MATKFNNESITDSKLNGNFAEAYTMSLLNLVRQLQDRAVTLSKGKYDAWGEAFTSAGGRGASVITDPTITTALFDTNKYRPGIDNISSSGTLHDPDTFTNPSNLFDDNASTSATKSGLSGAQNLELGKTFTNTYIASAYIVASGSANGGGSSITTSIKLQRYDGSTWIDVATVASGGPTTGVSSISFTGYATVNMSVQGLRLQFNTTNGSAGSVSATFTTLNYGPMSSTSQVAMTLQPDVINPGAVSSILAPLYVEWESGADVQYKVSNSGISTGFIIIEATSVAAASNWQINNCNIMQLATGKWALYCTQGSAAKRFAQVAKTLFYGTNGSDPRATSTYITGCTALKTPHSRDVGKRAVYAQMISTASSVSRTYTGTFANTSTNTSCRAWSYVEAPYGTGPTFQMPTATTLNSASSAISDETGTDTESEEKNNPATTLFSAGDQGTVRAIFFVNSTISWVLNSAVNCTAANTDFTVTHSMPTFTLATESFVDDSGWIAVGAPPALSTFTAFALPPTELVVRLVPKTSSPTFGYPSIAGIGVKIS